MSTWSIDEVKELTGEMNGGNDAARHNWLQNAPVIGERYPGGMRPKQGDKVEVYKQFILDCYEYGKFKASTPYEHDAASSIQVKAAVVTKPVQQQNSSPRKIANNPPPKEIDLLGFDNTFDTNFISSSYSADTFDPFQSSTSNDLFGNFQSSQALPTAASSNSSSNNAFDPFGISQPALSLVKPSPMMSSQSADNTPITVMTTHTAPALMRTQTYPISNNSMASGMNNSMIGSSPMNSMSMAPPNNMGMGGMGMMPSNTMGMGGMGIVPPSNMGMAPPNNIGMGMSSMGMGGMGMNSMGMNSIGTGGMGMAPPNNMGMNGMGGMSVSTTNNQSPLMMSSNSMMQRTNNNMGTSSMAISGLSATSMTHTNNTNNNVFASLYQAAPKY